MKPMLAFKLRSGEIKYPTIVQPKFNGIRALYLPKHRNLQSRDENLWEPSVVQHLLTQLTSLGFPTDGELYCHGLSLQQINSRVAVNRLSPHDKALEISYYMFDVISPLPMWKRAELLANLERHFKDKPHIVVAPTKIVHSDSEADYYYRLWKDAGYEGMMYRDYFSPYGVAHNCGNKENRWRCLLKRKEFLDLNATIVGVYEGEGGFTGMLGGFECVMDNGKHFNVGGGLDLDQRKRYWADPDKLIGCRIRINYEMLSDGGNPLKATIENVYELY